MWLVREIVVAGLPPLRRQSFNYVFLQESLKDYMYQFTASSMFVPVHSQPLVRTSSQLAPFLYQFTASSMIVLVHSQPHVRTSLQLAPCSYQLLIQLLVRTSSQLAPCSYQFKASLYDYDCDLFYVMLERILKELCENFQCE